MDGSKSYLDTSKIPIDVLRLICMNYGVRKGRKGRWGQYATFRLVCKRFAHAIKPIDLKNGLLEDFREIPTLCLDSPCKGNHCHLLIRSDRDCREFEKT